MLDDLYKSALYLLLTVLYAQFGAIPTVEQLAFFLAEIFPNRCGMLWVGRGSGRQTFKEIYDFICLYILLCPSLLLLPNGSPIGLPTGLLIGLPGAGIISLIKVFPPTYFFLTRFP